MTDHDSRFLRWRTSLSGQVLIRFLDKFTDFSLLNWGHTVSNPAQLFI